MSGDPEQDYFADGVVEEIITALSRFRQLFIIARNSSFTYKGRAVDVKQIGRELGVRYVLEGSVRRAANRVRMRLPKKNQKQKGLLREFVSWIRQRRCREQCSLRHFGDLNMSLGTETLSKKLVCPSDL